ncbi:MAG: CDP-diacylglycerol--glycerol-3-phosphate 3-phosphatidyltransferase, partial [Aquifex sp.]
MENALSLFRVFVTFPVVFLILKEDFLAAFWVYLIGAVTDWFDGNLARRNKRVSSFGKLLDPYADKVFVLLPLIALIEVKKVNALWVILLTFRELSIS